MLSVATSILPPSISSVGGGRLKEAVLDRSVARVDAVCHTLASRFPVTHQRLSRLGSAVTSSSSLKDLALRQVQVASVREFIVESVCATGLDFLERTEARWGLRERTEAIIDFILPPLDTCTQTDGADPEAKHAYEANHALRSLPRALTTHLLRTFDVQLSRSAKLQVTIVCLKDACAAAYQLLCRSDVWPSLAQMQGTTKDSGAVVARFARMLEERVFGGRLAIRVFGRLATVLGAACTLGSSDDTFSGIEAPETSHVEDPRIQDRDFSEAARATRQQFRLVVKNSFLEFLEEEPEVMRRVQSADILDQPASRIGLSEPFTLVVTCFDSVDVWRSVSNRPRCTGDIASRAEGSSYQGAQPSPDEAAPSAQSNAGSGDDVDAGRFGEESRTTIMLRNLPAGCTRSTLLATLDRHGFAGKYEFVYLPMDFSRGIGLGYALVSMASVAEAQRLRHTAPHIGDWGVPGDCFCEASWSEPQQDLAAHVERYRNSAVMHSSVPDEYKPVIFEGGVRVDFPAPTKAVRPPRIRHIKPGI